MVDIKRLEEIANQLRIDTVESVYQAKSGHIGGALSAAEFIAALYFYKLRVDPENPNWPDRDRFILSKGHSAPILYAALARRGFFPMEDLKRLRQVDSHLQGAPNPKTPGIDMSSGPLGQGLSAAVGMALAGKTNNKDYKVYCMVGDGEIQEGQIWEAAMTAAKYKLNNIICILDYNRVQMSGTNDELMPMGDVGAKFTSFGFKVYNINGHSINEIIETLDAVTSDNSIEQPILIISETVKGKGVSFMEGKAAWHGAVPSNDQYKQAMEELKGVKI
jgi:transketolase